MSFSFGWKGAFISKISAIRSLKERYEKSTFNVDSSSENKTTNCLQGKKINEEIIRF